jgi:indolepyruvate ferredoxin oxidoreductase beta subunit
MIKNNKVISTLFTGVGGQGILLATSIIARACLYEGLDVKVTEVHGMAQRGGSVVGSVRFGKKVFSPLISKADIIIALEKLESLRYIDDLNDEGIIIVNDYEILPVSIFDNNYKKYEYPYDVEKQLKKFTNNVFIINALDIAKNLDNIKTMNIILLGYLSNFLPIKKQNWISSINKILPKKLVDLNLKAFEIGSKF